MRVDLKGINFSKKRLADGSVVTYYYAWRNGPRLIGEPGTPEFSASYNEAVARKVTTTRGVILAVMQGFQASQEFLKLAQRTREDYVKQITLIETKFGGFPLSAMSDRRTRGIFMEWRDELALKSRRQADYAWVVLARILSWALNRGLIVANPCEKGGRLYRGSRVENVWSHEDEAAFLKRAPTHLHLALLLALWTGQRQGDLLRLPWSAYDGTHIRLRQSKTGRRVTIPVGEPLKVALDAAKKRGPLILTTADGQAWTSNGFGSSWGKARDKAGLSDLTFNDLRGTAVTRLALVGCTEAEIASITGHAIGYVRSIMDTHYLHRDPALAESAIKKLETGTKNSNRASNRDK